MYVVGSQVGRPIHWDPTTVTGNINQTSEIWVICYDEIGAMRWVMSFGGDGEEFGSSIVVVDTDDFLISAAVSDTFLVNGAPFPAVPGMTWVAKIEGLAIGDPEYDNSNAVKYFPNPGDGLIYHDARLQSELEVYTHMGQLVYTGFVIPGENVDLDFLPPGVYYLRTGKLTSKYVKTE